MNFFFWPSCTVCNVFVPQSEIEIRPSTVKVWSPNHWTAGDFLYGEFEVLIHLCTSFLGFPGGSDGKESACNAGDLSLIPGSERSPGGGNDYPLQYFCLENSMDRGYRPWGCNELDSTE